jgi:hypothetical protein
MPTEAPYLMKPIEIAIGYVFGQAAPWRRPVEPPAHPRVALEQIIGRALRQPPCGVAFSGGRDSSAVLGLATHLARRDGLPDPLPVTMRFPTASTADEDEWQDAVIAHLRLRDWHRIQIHDELDLIGPYAEQHLLQYGVVWPPPIASLIPMLEVCRGGCLLDGEGGDQVLGVAHHRIAPVTALVRSPRPIRWRRLAAVMQTCAPGAVRAREVRHSLAAAPRPWLRPVALEELVRQLEQVERDRPLSFAASVRAIAQRRGEVLGTSNRQFLALAHGVELVSPFLDPDFLEAAAAHGGLLGRGTRTAVLRELVSDLLPPDVLTRTTKATFNTCYVTARSREFAREWAGEGVDPDLIDCEELRLSWLSDWPAPATAALLQSCWVSARQPRGDDHSRGRSRLQRPCAT